MSRRSEFSRRRLAVLYALAAPIGAAGAVLAHEVSWGWAQVFMFVSIALVVGVGLPWAARVVGEPQE